MRVRQHRLPKTWIVLPGVNQCLRISHEGSPMSETKTPRTDAQVLYPAALLNLCRQLERELTEANGEIERLKEANKSLNYDHFHLSAQIAELEQQLSGARKDFERFVSDKWVVSHEGKS